METYPESGITIRPLDISNADDLVKWYFDEKMSKFSSYDPFTTKEAAIEHITNAVIPHPWHKAICLSGQAVGSISISPFHGIDKCRAELGYMVASEYWGKGIATAAVKMAANSIFLEWGHLERLEAMVAVENTASQRVLEKARFRREGVLRKYYLLKGKATDAVIFSLFSTDPQVNYFME